MSQIADLQTPYARLGGDAGVRRLADAFYDAMDQNPQAAGIRAMHAADLGPIKQRLYEFLSGWLGGPPLTLLAGRHVCMVSAHAPFAIDAAARAAWMACMDTALQQVGADEALAAELHAAFDRVAGMLADTA